MKVNNKFKKGFTLVELVVVIAVIAILAAVSVGTYFGVTDSANDSKLTSESANIKLNITLLGSEGNSYCNINKNYLEINNVTLFNQELNKDTGILYNVLINGTGNIDNSNDPIINFVGINNSDTKFDYFEYSTVEIVNKYIKVNLISGDSEIIKGNIEINDNDTRVEEPDIELNDEVIDNYIDNETGIRFKLGEDSSNHVSDKGTLLSEETYSISPEELDTNYYDLTLSNIKNLWIGAHSLGDGSLLLGKPVAESTESGTFSFRVKDEVKAVILSIASYNYTHNSQLVINGITTEAKNNTNTDRKIKVTTNTTKDITISTTEEYKYCYIKEIILVI